MNNQPIGGNVSHNPPGSTSSCKSDFASQVCCWLRELQIYSIEGGGKFPH